LSKRDPLRGLIRKFPGLEEMDGLLGSLKQENDRSAAIMSTALLEGMLERIITHRLPNKQPSLVAQLFENAGPLSDFHAKILIASALNIIPPPMERELIRIKKIRNIFAHSPSAVSFSTPEISKEIKRSYLLKVMQDAAVGRDIKPMEPSPRDTFLLVINLMLIAYDGWHQQRGGDPIIHFFSDCKPQN